ncbi:hypothetical protein WDW89_15475 [Deltaproteobacteria bacterium TL4]
MSSFHPNQIHRIVFDLNSIGKSFKPEDWASFEESIRILSDRDFKVILISKSELPFDPKKYTEISVLNEKTLEVLPQNMSLLSQDVFWVSDEHEVQSALSEHRQFFAGGTSTAVHYGGKQYQYLRDLIFIFNPSEISAQNIADSILKAKDNAPKEPFIVGVGGPEECGHEFFIEHLTEAIENRGVITVGMDLNEVLGNEFLVQSQGTNYWRSSEIGNWILDVIVLPYLRGERVYIEKPPEFIELYEITLFPFFLAPEMVLLLWGTTLFLPEFERFDAHILLELSPKSATARLFGLDDREDFDSQFIEDYEKKEGKLYREYLDKYHVQDRINYRVDFNNFHAFRLK